MTDESPPLRVEFWSSTEYGGFLEGLIRELNAGGLEARQRFVISESGYRRARGGWARLKLRFQQYIGYPAYLVWRLMFCRRAEVIVVCTNTFFVPLLATFLHRRVIHLVYDLFPEALTHAGKITDGGFLQRIISSLTQRTVNRAAYNVFLGERLRAYAESRYTFAEPGRVIPVGADSKPFGDFPAPRSGVPTILYCGNLGYMHDVDTLFAAWEQFASEPEPGLSELRWRFHTTGPRVPSLQRKVEALRDQGGLSVEVQAGLPQDEWLSVMQSAEAALVTMRPGSEEVVMPSKTYSALCAGQALLAIAPDKSDLADLVREYDCGWWVEPGEVEGLQEALREIVENPEGLLEKRRNAHRCGHEHFSQGVLARDWIRLIKETASRP